MGNTIDMNEMEPVARPLLPIFFVLDTSGSMTGQPISMLNHAMEEVINIVGNFAASNSDALLKIGVLQFSSGAKWIQPKGLEEFGDFIYNPLSAGGLTDMGAALNELDEKLSRKSFLVSTTGRCKPIIIFMTDGQPTDNWEAALKNIKRCQIRCLDYCFRITYDLRKYRRVRLIAYGKSYFDRTLIPLIIFINIL